MLHISLNIYDDNNNNNNNNNNKQRGFNPRANYIDRATAAFRRS
jgi:hypothetical protein